MPFQAGREIGGGGINLEAPTRETLAADAALGVMGDTGYSAGNHLYLAVMDMETADLLNPFSVLPALKDDTAPVIGGLFLKIEDELQPVESGTLFAPGEYEILVEAYDLNLVSGYTYQVCPYKILLTKEGRALSALSFSTLSNF